MIRLRSKAQKSVRLRKPVNWTRLKQNIVNFLERDDNSRVKAGKKSTITRQKTKKQTLVWWLKKNLHQKFISESAGTTNVSYSHFCRLKPFWVVRSTSNERETCLCKIHENLRLKLQKCHKENIVLSEDTDILMKTVTCNINSKECMYRECSNCDTKKRIPVNCEDEGKMLWWHEWKNRRIEKEKKTPSGESCKKTVSMTVKEKEIGTAGLLIESTNTELQKACRYVYNIRHQFSTLRHLKDVITNLEAIIQIDFSENFNCKYREEIQSMHFGASQRQISLHTGVVYMKNCTRLFCTISDCLRHDPSSIWAHLQPVLESLKLYHNSTFCIWWTNNPVQKNNNKISTNWQQNFLN